MRSLISSVLLLGFAVPAAAQESIVSHILDNGLEVIVIENQAVPLVTIELDVKNGAYTETPEYDGLSHLYEHMFFKANHVIPSQERYLQRLRELGAAWNGTTSGERVNYYITVGTDSLLPGMQFMEDAIRFPLFLQDELERERPVVLGEFDRAEANPQFHLGRAVSTLVWTPEYYSRKNVIGDRTIINTTTQEKMRTIQERFYVPNNSALILAGDVTPETGFQLAQEVFGDWPRGADPFAEPVPDPPPLATSLAVVVELPVQTVTTIMQWQGPSVVEDPQATYAADLLIFMLSNAGSRFQERLVDSGLAFGVNFGYFTQAHVGPISISAQTSPDKVLALRRAILEEVAHFVDPDYVSDEQMSAAKNLMAINDLYSRESSRQLAHTVGFWWAVASTDYYQDYISNIQRVSRDDIARFVNDYMIGKPFVTGVLISPEARAEIELTEESLLTQEMVP